MKKNPKGTQPLPEKKMLFHPFKKVCTFTGQPSILEVAIANEIPLNHSCGGMGSCTTCLIHVKSGLEKLSPREEVEAEHAQMRAFANYERLGCQTTAVDGLEVEIPTDKD